jgi:MFS family permease
MTEPVGRHPVSRDSRYSWVVLSMLMLAFTVSYIDRQVLNLVIDPIKADFGASDTQMSLLQGAAFITAYIAFMPVFGRWTDVGNRRNIIVFAVLTWSIFSILCGLAVSLPMLFVARAGVGAAEAALAPAAFSLLTDFFSKERLPRAMSIFHIGPYLGGGFALILGGVVIGSAGALGAAVPWLSGLAPWQLTFIVVGAIGLPLGIALLGVREPPRRVSASLQIDERRFSLAETWRYLWEGRSFYFRFFTAMALTVVVFYAFPAWMPALLIRNYGVDPREVGLTYGALVLVMGSLGVLTGPLLEAWLRRRGHKNAVVMCVMLAGIGLVPTCAMLLVVDSYASTLAVAAVATFLFSMPQPISASAVQLATPNRMRGVISSVYVLILSGVGLGVAPTLVALLTDRVFGDDARVNLSLGIVCMTSAALAAWLGFGALRPFRERLEAEERAASAGADDDPLVSIHASHARRWHECAVSGWCP